MLYAFDIDGTLIRSFMREGGGADDYDRVELLPGRDDAIQDLISSAGSRYMGFSLITNQAGVAMGYQTPEQVWAKMAIVVRELGFFHGHPLSVHICMHHPKAKLEQWRQDPCMRRKPAPGMLHEAIEAHDVLLRDTIFIGDMASDSEAAVAAGVRYVDADAFFG